MEVRLHAIAREEAQKREKASQAAADAVLDAVAATLAPATGDPWPERRPAVRQRQASW